MRYLIPAGFGFICGTVVGFFLVYVLEGTFKNSVMAQCIGGAVVGMIFGGVIGSISGEINASGESGAHRVVVDVRRAGTIDRAAWHALARLDAQGERLVLTGIGRRARLVFAARRYAVRLAG